MEPCGLCDRAIEQTPPLIGENPRFMFVLHKPDSRVKAGLWQGKQGYEIALGSTSTGKELTNILEYCDLTWEDIILTNFFKCTLPNDLYPKTQEYANCAQVLKKQIDELDPEKIVIFCKYSATKPHVPETEQPLLVMPHPSWIWAKRNKDIRKEHYERVRSFLY